MAGNFTRTLADCLDAIEQRSSTLDDCLARHPDHRAALTDLLPIALTLRSMPAVAPSPEFRANARRRLMTRIPVRPVTVAPRRSFLPAFALQRPALIMALAIAVFVVVLSSGIVIASAASLPNDPLYPVKIAVEQVRLAVSQDSISRSNLHLAFAAERLDEIDRLIKVDRGVDAPIALDSLTAHVQAAASIANAVPDASDREALIERVNASINQSDVTLTQAATQLPSSVQPAVQRAQETLRSTRRHEGRNEPPVITPTSTPTMMPTIAPTRTPTVTPVPTHAPAPAPTPTEVPAITLPTGVPTQWLTAIPTSWPTHLPANWPTINATLWPTHFPTNWPTVIATVRPTRFPTKWPTIATTLKPTHFPTAWPTPNVTHWPTNVATVVSPPHPTATPHSNATPGLTPIIFPTSIPRVWPTISLPRVSRP